MISDRVEDLYFQAKPILITSGLIKRRALEIAVEAKGDPKDLIILEIFCDGHDIRNAIFEVFLGKQSATAIILYEYVFEACFDQCSFSLQGYQKSNIGQQVQIIRWLPRNRFEKIENDEKQH